MSLFSLSVTFLISFPKSFFLLPIYHSLSIFFISFSLCILYIILYLYSLCDSLFVFLSLHQSIILIVSLPLLLSVFLSISIIFISFSLYLLYIISLHLLYIILSPSSLNHSLSVFFIFIDISLLLYPSLYFILSVFHSINLSIGLFILSVQKALSILYQHLLQLLSLDISFLPLSFDRLKSDSSRTFIHS